MRIHFIAIGGSAMHNLAIALNLKGYIITGSDDMINDPSKSRLAKYDLLPEKEGWSAVESWQFDNFFRKYRNWPGENMTS